MNEPELILTDNPDSEARQLIDDKLGDYNAERAGYWDPPPACSACSRSREPSGRRGHAGSDLPWPLVHRSRVPPGEPARTTDWHSHAAHRGGRGGAARLPRSSALYDQLPGAGVLRAPWLAGIRPHSMLSAGDIPCVHDEGNRQCPRLTSRDAHRSGRRLIKKVGNKLDNSRQDTRSRSVFIGFLASLLIP